MKILILTHYFWPEEFRINDLARAWKEQGHLVTVLTPMPSYPGGKRFRGYHIFTPRREDYHGIPVFRVPLITRGETKQMWRLALSYLTAAVSASVLGLFYCRGSFDCVFVYQPSPITTAIPAIIIKKWKRIPLMLWVQDLWPESLSATGFVRSSFILKIVGRLVRWIYRHCDHILVQSESFMGSIVGMGADQNKISYLPNWAEELYKPITLESDAPERTNMPSGFRVMFAGNIGFAQDFETILTAAERLRSYQDIHFVILGEGSARPWVEIEIQKRALAKSVHLLGRHPTETMPRFFSLADAMLVTLKRDPIFAFTIPGKVQSYLACGKPIIAALDGEGGRVVENAGAGIACGAEDPEALAQAILSLRAMSSEDRGTLGRNGRAYFETHFERALLLDRLEKQMRALAV